LLDQLLVGRERPFVGCVHLRAERENSVSRKKVRLPFHGPVQENEGGASVFFFFFRPAGARGPASSRSMPIEMISRWQGSLQRPAAN